MRCPVCDSNMTCLFVSYICDQCNPPKKTEPTKPSSEYKTGCFVKFLMDGISLANMNLWTVKVFKTKEDALSSVGNKSIYDVIHVIIHCDTQYESSLILFTEDKDFVASPTSSCIPVEFASYATLLKTK